MSKDLTTSELDRQNILNNPYALAEIENAAGIRGIPFEGKTVVLKEQVASFFEVSLRTIENYLEQNGQELGRNGYEVLKGKRLKDIKLAIQETDVPEIDFGNIKMTPQLGVFDFRAFLNLAMLMRESERASFPNSSAFSSVFTVPVPYFVEREIQNTLHKPNSGAHTLHKTSRLTF